MEVFTAHISPLGVAALLSLISTTLSVMFCPMIDVGATSISAGSFSIPLQDRYLIIENTTSETAADRVDYHHIQVSLADLPKDIPVEMKDGKVQSLGWPVSSVSFADAPLDVVQVDIYQHDETRPDYVDKAVYDIAIVVHARNGQKIAFSTHDAMYSCIELYRDEATIQYIEQTFVRRLMVPSAMVS